MCVKTHIFLHLTAPIKKYLWRTVDEATAYFKLIIFPIVSFLGIDFIIASFCGQLVEKTALLPSSVLEIIKLSFHRALSCDHKKKLSL